MYNANRGEGEGGGRRGSDAVTQTGTIVNDNINDGKSDKTIFMLCISFVVGPVGGLRNSPRIVVNIAINFNWPPTFPPRLLWYTRNCKDI